MSGFASGLYVGTVTHHRVRPVRHRLSYRVFSLLIDLDEVPELERRLRLFGCGRLSLIGFREQDHGPLGAARPEGSLADWVRHQCIAAGLEAGGAIRVLCFPRLLGLVFNPLSVYFCHRVDGSLAAILYEVSNTFGERHGYLIPAEPDADGLVRHSCAKEFYVSPFMDMEMTYNFRIRPPGPELAVAIRETDRDGAVLHALLAARRHELTDRSLAMVWLRHPLMTVKVLSGIHWEALKLWLKGLTLRPRPAPPAAPVTIVSGSCKLKGVP